jgi:L-fuconolactonase
LKGRFLPGDLEPLLARTGFDGCIVVEARQFPHENEWLLDLARAHPSIRGIVGWVDLCAPDVTARLERLTAHPRIKGFRHVVIDEPDERFLLREDFQRGIAALGPLRADWRRWRPAASRPVSTLLRSSSIRCG